MFFVFCLLTNWASIIAPMYIAAGSMRVARPKLVTFLVNLAMLFLVPLSLLPTMVPLGVATYVKWIGWKHDQLWCLGFALVECPLIIIIYRWILDLQGSFLQSRELEILNIVTTKGD